MEASHAAELKAARAELQQHLATIAALQARLELATLAAGAVEAGSGDVPAERTAAVGQEAEAEVVSVPESPELDLVEEVLEDLISLRTKAAQPAQVESKTSAAGTGQMAPPKGVDGERGSPAPRKRRRTQARTDELVISLDFSESEEAAGPSGSETEAEQDEDDAFVLHSIPPLSVRLVDSHLLQIRPQVMPKLRHRPAHDMTRAFGGILISGDCSLAERYRAELRSQGVTHIVSCCPMAPATADFRHLQLEFDDSAFVPVLRLLKPVEEFLKSKALGKQALIHCRQGINRCATIAVALRMQAIVKSAEQKLCGMPRNAGELLRESWAKVAEHRGSPIITNLGFQRQLLLFANLLLLTDSQAKWPEDWGPEVWLRPGGAMGLSSSQVLKARTLREKVEHACLEAGMRQADAICAASRIVDLFMRRRGVVG